MTLADGGNYPAALAFRTRLRRTRHRRAVRLSRELETGFMRHRHRSRPEARMQVGVLSQAIAGRCFSSPPANRQDNYMRWRGGRFSPRPPTEDEAEIVWPSTQISRIYLEIFGPICQISRNFLDFFREIRPNIFAYSRLFSPIATFRAYFFSIFRFFAIFRENHPNFSRKFSDFSA